MKETLALRGKNALFRPRQSNAAIKLTQSFQWSHCSLFIFVYVSEKFKFRANASSRGNLAAALCEEEQKKRSQRREREREDTNDLAAFCILCSVFSSHCTSHSLSLFLVSRCPVNTRPLLSRVTDPQWVWNKSHQRRRKTPFLVQVSPSFKMPCTKYSVFKSLYTVALIALVPFHLFRISEIIANVSGSEPLHLLQLGAFILTELADTILFIAGLIFICSVKTPTASTTASTTTFTGGNQTPKSASRNASSTSPNEKLLKNTIFIKGASVFCSLLAIAIGLYRSVDSFVTLFAFNIIMISVTALFAFLICKDGWCKHNMRTGTFFLLLLLQGASSASGVRSPAPLRQS